MCQIYQGSGAVLHVRGTTAKGGRLLFPLQYSWSLLALGLWYYYSSPGHPKGCVVCQDTGYLTGHSGILEVNVIKSLSLLDTCCNLEPTSFC